MGNGLARSGGATLAKSARGGFQPILFPKAPAVAASARSGLAAKVSHADVLLAKVPAAGDSLPQAVSGVSRATAWLSRPYAERSMSTTTKFKAQAAGASLPSCLAANVGLSFAANAAAAGQATARKGAAGISSVTRGLSTTTKAKAAVASLPSCLATKVNVAAAGKVTARKGAAGIPLVTRGLSTTTKVMNPAAGQATARKIPPQGKATANLPLRTAVVVWSVAAGLTATWYLLKQVPDSDEPEIYIRFDPSMVEVEEFEEPGIPDSLDWSELGLLPDTPRVISFMYNTLFCGCCFAIATVKSVEWAYAIKYGRVFPLSVQQVIDCGYKYSYGPLKQYQGCLGGQMKFAFQNIIETGLTIEKAYPCSFWQGKCRLAGKPIAVRIDGFEEIVCLQRQISSRHFRLVPLPSTCTQMSILVCSRAAA